MKRCLLVGAAPSRGAGLDAVLQSQVFDAIYAVDGGYSQISDRGLICDAVFGDFDSLGSAPDLPCVYEYDAYKDFTDMDLALHHAVEHGFDELVLCNAFTGRLDHTIGNMQLLIQMAEQGTCIWGVEEDEVIAPLVAPGAFSCLSFEEGAEGVCSVLSHSDMAEGVVESGLEWNLEDATVTNRTVWGISNEFTGKPSKIELREGSAWVMFPLSEFSKVHYDHWEQDGDLLRRVRPEDLQVSEGLTGMV